MAHYLITGHTGFKGAWLSVLLRSKGHTVSGISLNPEPGSLFSRALTSEAFCFDLRFDIQNQELVARAFEEIAPDFVIHLAAQSLVREGYSSPKTTYETNVIGTLNVLEAVEKVERLKAALIVTSDKVYQTTFSGLPFKEDDSLGGQDPYSASKAMADIAAQEFALNRSTTPIGIARAGNVIGAGDSSKDRLIPDIVRCMAVGKALELRYPRAIRPWQHVLDCIDGYLLFLNELSSGRSKSIAYNFGPPASASSTVEQVVEIARSLLAPRKLQVETLTGPMKEDSTLSVDSTRARRDLGWTDRLTLEESIRDGLFDALNLDNIHILDHMLAMIGSREQ